MSKLWLKFRLFFMWGTANRKEFYTMAAGFIHDGKPVYDTLQVFAERWREKKDVRGLIVEDVMAAMRGRRGHALRMGQAIGAWVPTMEAMAIDAGEQSGDVAGGMRMAAHLSETKGKVNSTIIGEMIYPAFLVALFIGFMIAIKFMVIPVFSEIAPRALWPSSAQWMGRLADNAMLISGMIVALFVGTFTAFHATKGRWVGPSRDGVDGWLPPWSIHRQVSSAILMTCFSLFIKAGIPFSDVINKLSMTASAWERDYLDRMRSKMRRGVREGDAMAVRLFDEDVRWEIGVYGGMTSFAQALESLSNRVTERVLGNIKNSAAIARMIVMILVAAMIVWVYGSFFDITMAARRASSV